MLSPFWTEGLCLVQVKKESAFDRISFISVPCGPRCSLRSGRRVCASFRLKKKARLIASVLSLYYVDLDAVYVPGGEGFLFSKKYLLFSQFLYNTPRRLEIICGV